MKDDEKKSGERGKKKKMRRVSKICEDNAEQRGRVVSAIAARRKAEKRDLKW